MKTAKGEKFVKKKCMGTAKGQATKDNSVLEYKIRTTAERDAEIAKKKMGGKNARGQHGRKTRVK